MKSGKAAKTDKRVSIASKDALDIRPVVYSFRVLGGGPESGSVMTAIRPPYWLYHDHALGVIWMLFHNTKSYIGITQLHWCLRFLLDLKNSQGEYTGDVDLCIRLIQDNLIEQYAKLGTAMENPTIEKSPRSSKDDDIVAMPSENPDESESIAIEDENISENTLIPDEVDRTSDNRGETEEEIFSKGIDQKIAGTSSPNVQEAEPERSKSNEKNEEEIISEDRCGPTRCGSKRKKGEIVSITYNEMMSRGPAPCMEQSSNVDLFDEGTFFNVKNKKTADEMRRDGDRARKNLADSSTKEMVNFLNSSRQQHIERIRKEIERLHGLERFMENFNANGFSAYVTEDLARRMENLENEDVVKEANEMTRKN